MLPRVAKVQEMRECSEEEQAAMPGPSGAFPAVSDGWLNISDPNTAISACTAYFLHIHEMESPLLLSMDMRKSPAEQDLALISSYKRPNVEWVRPLNCRLEGDTAIGEGATRFFMYGTCMEKLKSGCCISFGKSNVTRLFEGEPGHLVPSASHFLVESDMFLVAGRMVVYSFLHGEPCLSGLSPAVLHVLLGGSPETVTVTLEDCPDLDIRGNQALLTKRPDTVGLFSPSEGIGSICPEVFLQRITWPAEEDDEDDDWAGETKCRISGYLREFITNGITTDLMNLVKFWTGWEILPTTLSVEIVKGRNPTASTCYETSRIPGHYKDYMSFKSDILACISTCNTGFGLV